MPDGKDEFREKLLKKTLMEIEALIAGQKKKISAESNLLALNRLNTELRIMQEVRDIKLRERDSGRPKSGKPSPAKPELKSFEDYEKSKKDKKDS